MVSEPRWVGMVVREMAMTATVKVRLVRAMVTTARVKVMLVRAMVTAVRTMAAAVMAPRWRRP